MEKLFASLTAEQLSVFLKAKIEEEEKEKAKLLEQETGLKNNDIPLVSSGVPPVDQQPVEKQPSSGSNPDSSSNNQQESGLEEIGAVQEDKESSSSSSSSSQGGSQPQKEIFIQDLIVSGTKLVTEASSTKPTEPAVVGREQVVVTTEGDTHPLTTSKNTLPLTDLTSQSKSANPSGSDASSKQVQFLLVENQPKESGVGSKRKEIPEEEIGAEAVQQLKKPNSSGSSISQAQAIPVPVITKRKDEDRIESSDSDQEIRGAKAETPKKKSLEDQYEEILADRESWSNGRYTGDVNGKRETNQTVSSLKKKLGLPDDHSPKKKHTWTVRNGSDSGSGKSNSSSGGTTGASSSSSSSSSSASNLVSSRPKRTPKPVKVELTYGQIDDLIAEKLGEFREVLRSRSQVPLLVLHRSFDIYQPDSADYLPGGLPTASGACNTCAKKTDSFCGGCTELSRNPTDKNGKPRQIHWLCLKCQTEHTASFAFQLAECAYEVVIREENNWV